MSKYVVLIAILLIVHSNVNAQTEQGRIGISGSLSIGTSDYSNSLPRSYNISASPSILYFIYDGLAITPGATFNFTSTTDYSSHSESVTAGLAYYFGTSSLKPFISASVGTYHYHYTSSYSHSIYDVLSFIGNGGLAYFFSNSVALTGNLRFIYYDYYQDSYGKFDFNGLSLIFGLTYIIPK
jgi:hypothetical protein